MSILAAIANGLKALAIALGWMKQASDQNSGRKLQASDDAQASLTAATETRTDEDNVHRLTDDELNKRLRGS